MSITEDRKQRLLDNLNIVISQISSGSLLLKARTLASISGQIISMKSGIGNIVSFMTRYLFNCLQTRASWNSPVLVDYRVLEELTFWKEHVSKLNGQPLIQKYEFDPDVEVYSDASHTGYGGYILDKRGSAVFGSWSDQESTFCSTWRELVAVSRVLNSKSICLEGHTIKWCTDSKNVKQILEVGSKKRHLQDVALEIKNKCDSIGSNVIVQWIPREQNVTADFLSRCNDSDDWQISFQAYNIVDHFWGPHTVDRFATDYNSKCSRFNSRWWCPGTEVVDAFTSNWSNENNWVVPPPRLICRTCTKIITDKAKATLVVPCWYSAPFWPLFFSSDSIYYNNITGRYFFRQNCTIPGRGNNGIFGKGNIPMVAIRLEF